MAGRPAAVTAGGTLDAIPDLIFALSTATKIDVKRAPETERIPETVAEVCVRLSGRYRFALERQLAVCHANVRIFDIKLDEHARHEFKEVYWNCSQEGERNGFVCCMLVHGNQSDRKDEIESESGREEPFDVFDPSLEGEQENISKPKPK